MTKEDMFKKIKAEIEGGLFEDLLRRQEDNDERSIDSQELDVLDKVMFNKDEIIRRYRPFDKLLKEFFW